MPLWPTKCPKCGSGTLTINVIEKAYSTLCIEGDQITDCCVDESTIEDWVDAECYDCKHTWEK